MPNIHEHQFSGIQYTSAKSQKQSIMLKNKTDKVYSEVYIMSCLLRLTCVKSLAPATSTNITLLQSINTAWTSLSDVSAEQKQFSANEYLHKCKHTDLKNVENMLSREYYSFSFVCMHSFSIDLVSSTQATIKVIAYLI